MTDYAAPLNAVREQRDISLELMNEIAGAPDRYFHKILGTSQCVSKSRSGRRATYRRLGLHSLGWALGWLGVKGILVDDPDMLALIQRRFEERDAAHSAFRSRAPALGRP